MGEEVVGVAEGEEAAVEEGQEAVPHQAQGTGVPCWSSW